jgi:hypothetical protein
MEKARPKTAAIRKAFGEYTTECFSGYEQTAWDLMNIVGLETMFEILESKFPHAGIYEPFEGYSENHVMSLISKLAWSKSL